MMMPIFMAKVGLLPTRQPWMFTVRKLLKALFCAFTGHDGKPESLLRYCPHCEPHKLIQDHKVTIAYVQLERGGK